MFVRPLQIACAWGGVLIYFSNRDMQAFERYLERWRGAGLLDDATRERFGSMRRRRLLRVGGGGR